MKNVFLCLLMIFVLAACGKDDNVTTQAQQKFREPDPNCYPNVVTNEYNVLWKNGKVTKINAENDDAALEQIKKNIEDVKFIEPEYRIQPKPIRGLSRLSNNIDNWGLQNIEADVAWKQGLYGNDVVIAVIDDGVDVTHPQLQPVIFYNDQEIPNNGVDDDGNGLVDDYAGYNFAARRGGNQVTGNHGTHVAGIIAAHHSDTTYKTDKVQGLAPKAKILPVDFIDETGGTMMDAVDAINYAVQRGAHIINASWGGGGCSVVLGEKINELGRLGILFVAASGNSGYNIDSTPQYPASYNLPNMITVGATSEWNGMTYFSNYGVESVHIFAPGNNIISTYGTGYQSLSGTSMSAPYVSAAAAIAMQANPSISMLELRSLLLNSGQKDESYLNSSQSLLNIRNMVEKRQPTALR
ncbi:MAG: S8 family serine peptidase [Bdellovibrionales bacterium]|nr:S8 family serine peptidase [Bdellovibrionales bacterium]